MSTSPITVEHGGITITYDERRNLFCFELRGRERTADSLAKAREAIDKPVKEKTKPFERFKAWWNGSWASSSSGWKQVEVTSIAQGAYGNDHEVWINIPGDEEGRFRRISPVRQKTRAESVFPCNEKNDALVAQMLEFHKQASAIQEQADKLVKGLKPYVIPKED